jgi:hypothetical protein
MEGVQAGEVAEPPFPQLAVKASSGVPVALYLSRPAQKAAPSGDCPIPHEGAPAPTLNSFARLPSDSPYHLDINDSRGMYTSGTAACVDSTRADVVLPVPGWQEGQAPGLRPAARGVRGKGAFESTTLEPRPAWGRSSGLRGGCGASGSARRRVQLPAPPARPHPPGGPSNRTARGRLPLPEARVRFAMWSYRSGCCSGCG